MSEAKGHVFPDGKMGKQGVGLKDDAALSLGGGLAGNVDAPEKDPTHILLFQPGEQARSWHQGSALEHAVLAVCSSAVLVLGLFPEPILLPNCYKKRRLQ